MDGAAPARGGYPTGEGIVQHLSCSAFGAPATSLEVSPLFAAEACGLCGRAGSPSRLMS